MSSLGVASQEPGLLPENREILSFVVFRFRGLLLAVQRRIGRSSRHLVRLDSDDFRLGPELDRQALQVHVDDVAKRSRVD